ncbi:MAG: alanine racemase [Flavobacteriales bacterium]|nr:alanine racemase [Flavobacteriales bacterium]
MFDASTIELSTAALRNNIAFIRQALAPGTRLCTVVKGNAYGHGIGTFTGLARRLGAEYFAVYSAAEAYQLQKNLAQGVAIYIMGDVDGPALEWAVEHGAAFNIFELDRLSQAIRAGRAQGKRARVHLEVETGMHRTGIPSQELPLILESCKTHADAIDLQGICSHLAGAESGENHLRIAAQKLRFQEALAMAAAHGAVPPLRHLACSAGILNEPDTLYDMARVGILHYGFWPNGETRQHYMEVHGLKEDPLARVIRWRSRVIAVSTVPPGGFVGYGNAFQAQRETKIATIPTGYAYGYSRSLSNTGHVLIHGCKAPVRGMVNMNCITVDITDIEGVEKGDEAVLIGSQGGESISVASFGDLSDQLNYELLARLPHAIPRVVVDQHP